MRQTNVRPSACGVIARVKCAAAAATTAALLTAGATGSVGLASGSVLLGSTLPGATFLGLALVATPATADGTLFATRGGKASFEAKLKVLDGRASRQYARSVRLQPKTDRSEELARMPRYGGRYDGPYLTLARDAARKHGIPEDLFLRLVHRESGFNAGAVSHKGAVGLAQLMPETATLLAVDAQDPAANLEGGARYLGQLYKRFGSWKLALAGYNAGPEAVEKYAGVPPYDETLAYVAAILGE